MDVIDKMSIGGYAFPLDPAAKTALETYLGKIQAFYRGKESGDEIVDGIEGRIAELLLEKRGDGSVVTGTDIEEIIGIMGYPDEMDSPEENTSEEPRGNERKETKRLYRDPKNGVIAGVCSGLANYFKVDVVLARIVFVALFAVSFLGEELALAVPLIYLALVFCMPAAKTVKQRWEMKGDDGSVEEVERKVRRGADEAEVSTRSELWEKLGKIILTCIGILMIITGIAGLVTIGIGAVSGAEFQLMPKLWREYPEAAHWSAALLDTPWVYGCILAAVGIPFIGLLWGGIQLCFGLKSPKWHPGIILFILWIAAMVAVTAKAFFSILPDIL